MHNYVCWGLDQNESLNVTGFAKTVPNGTRIEIQFIADYYTYTLALSRNSLLSQIAYCQPCQITKGNYRVCEASKWHNVRM